MVLAIVECAAGFALACLTLRDVFDTVVVPGGSHGWLRVSRRLVFALLPLWKRVRQREIGVNFAPVVLVGAFVIWLLLLVLAFGLMAHAFAGSFAPRLRGLGDGMYAAGSAMTTIGLGQSRVSGPGAVVMLGAGFCGLAVVTLAVTYLLQVQGSIGERDKGVLKITTTTGEPPSGLRVLERYAALGSRDDLPRVLHDGRDWCAAVLRSHLSHPSLVYFRSAGTGAGWPSTVGAFDDMALMIELLLDEPRLRGPAILLREECERVARQLTEMLGLAPVSSAATRGAAAAACDRLRAAGYRVREDADLERFLQARNAASGCIDALSEHLGTQGAPLAP